MVFRISQNTERAQRHGTNTWVRIFQGRGDDLRGLLGAGITKPVNCLPANLVELLRDFQGGTDFTAAACR
jgi:hypothetical protein